MPKLVQIGKVNFRFECQPGCTDCCKAPGDVFLSEDDIERIAPFLDLTPGEFRELYCADDEGPLRLEIPRDVHCPFLEEEGCSIHPVKPLQCQVYPFWPENLTGRTAWKKTRNVCRGIGVGPILPVEPIREQAQALFAALPDF